MSGAADPLSAAFASVSRTEAALRDAVRTDLSRVYGPLWMGRIPEELRLEWRKRQQADEADGPSRGPELIEYANIADVIAVIKREPDVFSARFGEATLACAEFEQFRLLRNNIMHNGARMSERECTQAARAAQTLLQKCQAEVSCMPPAAPPVGSLGRLERRPSSEEQRRLYNLVTGALADMSGRLTGERSAVMKCLRENLVNCSPDTLAAVQAKFGSLSGTQQIVDDLYRELPPARPAPPPVNSRKPADWLKWADTQYIPYRRWLIRTRREDEEISGWALNYEDWLAGAYPGMLQSAAIDNTVVTAYKLVEQQLREGARTIWLVVDNLAGLWRWEFQSALREAGFTLLKSRRSLALLPSSTYISRRAMLAGRLPSDVAAAEDEETACRKLWRDQGYPTIAYCTQLRDVEQAIQTPVPLIVFVYNWIDRLAHMADDPGFDREEQMSLAMGTLAVQLGGAVRRMRQTGPARLVISTDHGSTRAGPSSQLITVPPSAIPEGADPDEHRRYIFTEQTSGLNSHDWHILRGSDCGLPGTAAVVRGQRFINGRPRAYVHGGLSPEETVTAVFVAEIGAREPVQLKLSVNTAPLRRGRPGPIAIRVRNEFDVPIESLVLRMPGYGVTFAPLDIPPRSELPTEEQTVTLEPGTEVSDGVGYVSCTGSYQIAGQRALLSERLAVPIQEIYRAAMDDFGEMFDG